MSRSVAPQQVVGIAAIVDARESAAFGVAVAGGQWRLEDTALAEVAQVT